MQHAYVTWGCYPSLWSSRKINPTLWRFRVNLLRIDWDIDENVQFYSKHGVVTPHCNRLQKLILLCEVSSQSIKNWLRYWWKCAVLLKKWGCYPSLRLSQKINPSLWRFQTNLLRYWWKCAVLLETWGCYPSLRSSQKINPTLWRFRANPLRIDWDIDESVQFYSKHRVVTPHYDPLKKLTLLCEGFEPIH